MVVERLAVVITAVQSRIVGVVVVVVVATVVERFVASLGATSKTREKEPPPQRCYCWSPNS